MSEKFYWAGKVLFQANGRIVAGWVGYDTASQFWYARTSGGHDRPVVRGEFDNEQSAQDFLMFIANTEDK
jgi:hypothetical protein